MSDEQFVRFKSAGRQTKSTAGKKAGTFSRDRPDRTGKGNDLQQWDVTDYGRMKGQHGAFGSGSLTNRDHMTANSSNKMRFRNGEWAGTSTSEDGVAKEALAIAVSGNHHKKASWTYGGRTKTADAPNGKRRMEYGAENPTDSFRIETESMLRWKSDHISNTTNETKNTVRLEMVGGYAYMYRQTCHEGHIVPSIQQDQPLMTYLKMAVMNDNATGNKPRKVKMVT